VSKRTLMLTMFLFFILVPRVFGLRETAELACRFWSACLVFDLFIGIFVAIEYLKEDEES
jgi:hypothetical protein